MGLGKNILLHVAKDIVKDAAVDAAVGALDKASEKSQKRTEKKIEKILKDDSANVHLIVSNPRNGFSKTYSVFAPNMTPKYQIKGSMISRSRHLTILDVDGKKLATIKEKLISLRSPLSSEIDPKDYAIEIDGKKLGMIKSQGTLLSRKYEISFNDWVVKGNVLRLQYVVSNGKEIILKVNIKPEMGVLSEQEYYYLDIYKPENELIGLVIATVLDIASMSNEKEIKKAIEKNEQLNRRY